MGNYASTAAKTNQLQHRKSSHQCRCCLASCRHNRVIPCLPWTCAGLVPTCHRGLTFAWDRCRPVKMKVSRHSCLTEQQQTQEVLQQPSTNSVLGVQPLAAADSILNLAGICSCWLAAGVFLLLIRTILASCVPKKQQHVCSVQ